MKIQKKSQETLKRQKESFFNIIKNKNKYSKAISDIFYDENIEKCENIEEVKEYLKSKSISDELIKSLEKEYIKHLRGEQYFYGPTEEYSESTKNTIEQNNKILKEIKEDILNNYKNEGKYLRLDINKFIEEGFNFGNKEKKSIRGEIDKLEKENLEISKETNKTSSQLYKTGFFKFSAKKALKQDLKMKHNKYEENKKEIEKRKNWKEKIEEIKGNIQGFVLGKEGRNDMEKCKKSMSQIRQELNEIIDYIDENTIKEIKEDIQEQVYKQRKIKKDEIIEKTNKYLNIQYFGEDKGIKIIEIELSHNSTKDGTKYREDFKFNGDIWTPTLYAKSRIEPRLSKIIRKIGGKTEKLTPTIDYNFINDVFIHTTGFDVLDEILDEGGLVSTNEMRKRGKKNEDCKKTVTQKVKPHKDIYFSRGFRKNFYGEHEYNGKGGFINDDFVFIANTMNNFANSGYGVPLNQTMQGNRGFAQGYVGHDEQGYSIISKSAINKSDDSYSKINIKDVYIFICESKKEIIESHPEKYKISEANIIYYPKKYKGFMSYELSEYIKKEIKNRENEKEKHQPIPKKIIKDDNIKSIREGYERAFCEPTKNDNETEFNPLKNGDYNKIIKFFKENHGAQRLKKYENFEIDFNKIKGIFNEKNKYEIKEISKTFNYPHELIILIVACISGFKRKRNERRGSGIYELSNKLAELGYSGKDLAIFYKTVTKLCKIFVNRKRIKEEKNSFKKEIIEMCNDWDINYNKMKDFLIRISKMSVCSYIGGKTEITEYVLN